MAGGIFWTLIVMGVVFRLFVRSVGHEKTVRDTAARGLGMFLNRLFK